MAARKRRTAGSADELTRAGAVIAFIEKFLLVPEGSRVGEPVRLLNFQKEIIRGIYDGDTRRAIVSFGRKNGKGLALDTPIPTTSGWKTMGSLAVGDEVFDERGALCRVTYASPVHIGLRCWRLTFADGTSVVADEEHRWLTSHRYRPWAGARRNGPGNGGRPRVEVLTTPQIADSVRVTRPDGGTEYTHRIAVAGAVENPEQDLPVPP